ncbi:MAG TPA: tRNA uridine-5-carboxymethylaminomethyl(34) synthesis GTPase MnmE, partial [Geobacter anodireducens]|nr:tRNA uridine-5-carboxymethylaminomethyl(34) synthesis GTPase MnmE [Geobacter anodireducens]
DELRNAIFQTFIHGAAIDSREYVAVSRVRHRDLLSRATMHLAAFEQGLASGFTLELLAVEVGDGLAAVGEVTGEETRFCIGK